MSKNKRKLKGFWNSIRFKYRLTILNENTLEDIFTFRVSKLNIISVSIFVILFSFIVSYLFIAFTPIKNYLPGYVTNQLRDQIVENYLLTDSLSERLNSQQNYLNNVQNILKEKVTNRELKSNIDSISKNGSNDSIIQTSDLEKEFVKEYEAIEQYNITSVNSSTQNNVLYFTKPISGKIIKHFDEVQKSFGVTILPDKDQSVLSTMDGVIAYVDYSLNNGNTIIITHNNDCMSVYKNCGLILKKEGDIVKSSEPIAQLVNEKGKDKSITFEIKQKGFPLPPERYINF